MAKKDYEKYVKWKEKGLAHYATSSVEARKVASVDGNPYGLDLGIFSMDDVSYRTPFEIDSDMIIQSRYFPLLSRKTQIFIAPENCHFRTRNSHTLTVMRLAKNIGNGLRLNTDLIEAMAYGHDVGHTAFGHSAETELDAICQEAYCALSFDELRKTRPRECSNLRRRYGELRKLASDLSEKKFLMRYARVKDILKHPEEWDRLKKDYMLQEEDTSVFNHGKQGFRLLCLYAGKNISAQTVYGIVAHNLRREIPFEIMFEDVRIIERPRSILKEKYDKDKPIKEEKYLLSPKDATLEAQVVKFADFLAFSMHDFDDATRAGLMDLDTVRSEFDNQFKRKYDFDKYFGTHRYTKFVNDFVVHNLNRELEKILTVNLNDRNMLEIPPKTEEILSWLYTFIKDNVHNAPTTLQTIKREQAAKYIRYAYQLFMHYRNDPPMFKELGFDVPELRVRFSPNYDDLRIFCDLMSFKTDDDLIELERNYLSPRTTGKRHDL
jgi:dGTP triphosphohydrolase